VTPEELQHAERLTDIFMPNASRLHGAAIANNRRFVHYTSAVAGLEIIKTKQMWMRNTTCMSDYREVQHGADTFNRFFDDPASNSKSAFFEALNGCAVGIAEEAINLFNQSWDEIKMYTYISSISEHDDREDLHGRLSMWRAFGRTNSPVALVLRVPLTSAVPDSLNILLSPVAYFTDAQLSTEMHEVIANIHANQPFLRALDRPRLLGMVFNMLVTGVVCLKHEGFLEEHEWRVIYSPKRKASPLITFSIEVVEGVPQLIYKLPLDSTVSVDLAAIDIANLIDRVIIGPSNRDTWAMYEVFVLALTAVGVKDADKRVFISGIPIRT
jgi:hypothetical protein